MNKAIKIVSAKVFVVVSAGVEICWQDAQRYNDKVEESAPGIEVVTEAQDAPHNSFVGSKVGAWDAELRQLKLLGLTPVVAVP